MDNLANRCGGESAAGPTPDGRERQDRQGGESPELSIIIPCYQEAGQIESCLGDVLAQEDPGGGFEVLVVDGMSTDGTREAVGRVARADDRVRLLDNPDRTVPHAMNIGIEQARGRVIVRMDAHTRYAADYVRRCAAVLEATGADNVGGPWVARGQGYWSRAIAAASCSWFAVGGARCHREQYEGPVDTVYLGCWRRETLLRIGGFDRELARNQDDELNFRMLRAGMKLWQSPEIRSWYCPRGSLRKLFRQYFQYGFWKVRVMQKHGRPASLRHVVPALFVAGIVAGLPLMLLLPVLQWAYFGVLSVYLLLLWAAAIHRAARAGWELLPALVVVIATYHVAYGAGTLAGLWHFVVRRRSGGRAVRQTALTR